MKNSINIVAMLALFLLLSFNTSYSQETFEKIVDLAGKSYGNSIQQTRDGGYILTGGIQVNGTGNFDDMLVVKINSQGDTVWTKIISKQWYEIGNSIQKIGDGGYILAGVVNAISGLMDMYISKLDSNGNNIWNKTYKWSIYQQPHRIKPLLDGGFLLVGGMGAPNSSGFLFKINETGDSVWLRIYSEAYSLYDLQLTENGGYIFSGFDLFGRALLWKTDSLGETQWTRTDSGLNYADVYSIKQSRDGGYILTGGTKICNACPTDIQLVKLTSSGAFEWRKTIGDSATRENAVDVEQTMTGDFIVLGNADNNGNFVTKPFIIKTDSLGDTLWTKKYGAIGTAVAISSGQLTSDGGIIATGGINPLVNNETGFYLLKLSSDGVLIVNEHPSETPKQINLYQNYPNPFNPATTIQFTLASAQHVSITIYTILGKEVETILDKNMYAGDHTVIWDAKDKPAGVYMYRLVAGTTTETKKLLFIK